MRSEPHRVAARLGLDKTTIARLQANGHLTRLALSESAIRARLYRAHLDYMHRLGARPDVSARPIRDRRRP